VNATKYIKNAFNKHIKGMFHPKILILLSIIHVIPNLFNCKITYTIQKFWGPSDFERF